MNNKSGKQAIHNYCTEKNISKNQYRYVSDNWNQFTSWLDHKIRSGVYEGKVVSTVNPNNWSEKDRDAYYAAQQYKYKQKLRKEFSAFYASFTDEEKQFMNEFKAFVGSKNWLNLIRIYSGQIFNEPCPKGWEVTIRLVKLAYSRKEEFWTAVKSFKRFQNVSSNTE